MCCSLQLVDPATGFLFGNSTLTLNVKTYTEVTCVAENVVHTGASSDTKTATVNVTGAYVCSFWRIKYHRILSLSMPTFVS